MEEEEEEEVQFLALKILGRYQVLLCCGGGEENGWQWPLHSTHAHIPSVLDFPCFCQISCITVIHSVAITMLWRAEEEKYCTTNKRS